MNLQSNSRAIALALQQKQQNYQWSAVLLQQHEQLAQEIQGIQRLLERDLCYLLQLDKALKKLIKGVLTHLELETCFIVPGLTGSELSDRQKYALTQGYTQLQQTCHDTSQYLHRLKLTKGNCLISHDNHLKISHFLQEISQRLQDEDLIYARLKETEVAHAL